MYSSPRAQCVITPTRFDCVPEGTNTAASKPRSSATSASSAMTVGSSPSTSSPTSAAAIALRIPSLGRVTVSLRKSVAIGTSPRLLRRGGSRPALALSLQLRKQDHVADRRRVGQEHYQPIDTDAFARRRRQAVLHRANVIGVVVHLFLVARLARFGLAAKARGLVFGVVQFGEPVGDLAAADEELEAIRHRGI